MRCPNCQHPNDASARYCANCGAELARSDVSVGQSMQNGKYRVVRRLGKGGMGAIYLAQNTRAFDRLCVIKQLIAYYQPGEERQAEARFETEARTLAALKHPGIPDMYGYFREAGRNYIVMEYIEGQNLEQMLDDHGADVGLDSEQAARYGVEVCRVLEYLAGVKPEPVVHCDIKPANIIVDRNGGQAILVDFGTARGRYAHLKEAPDGKRPSVYGTVGYAAPELFRGEAVPRSDVFSLAATLYHLLTHDDPQEHPFKWPRMDRLSPEWQRLLRACLATEPEKRPDPSEMRRRMEAQRAQQSGGVQPLRFPDGDMATTLTGMLDLSFRHWEYARELLYDGSLDHWLRHALHDPVAANRVREATQDHPDQPDAGLDALLRGLNPRLPRPTLVVSDESVSLPADGSEGRIRLTNEGPGGAGVSVRATEPWLTIEPAQIGLAPGQSREVTVRLAANAPKGASARGSIRIASSAGQKLDVAVRSGRQRNRPTQTAQPTQPKKQPAQSKQTRASSQSGTRTRPRLTWLWVLLVVITAGVGGYLLLSRIGGSGVSDSSFERGLEALDIGDWERAARLLNDVDPGNDAQVWRLGETLDGQVLAIDSGKLLMGSESSLAADQKPAHSVEIGLLLVDRFEVTQLQYQRFVDTTGHAPPAGWSGGDYAPGEALLPVSGVSWSDAQAYAQWTNKRLPTEAEWEWVARGQEGRLYPWGNQESSERANTRESGSGHAASVGSYPGDVTPDGVFDLGGNVREWTTDRYGPYRDPHAPPANGDEMVVRGGSFESYQDTALARSRVAADEQLADLGFRCVR